MSSASEEVTGASAKAIQFHYDVSNEFYALWLDSSMTYSCPLWEAGDDLDAAQQRKYDYHIAQSQAAEKARVLDVGCGWGGQIKRLISKAGVQHAVGLTLSEAQLQANRAANIPNTEFRLESWADHNPSEKYDAAISIGALEHFAAYGISQEKKVQCYRDFFKKMHELLKPGARLSLQTMSYGTIPRGHVHRDLFIANEIFPESDFPRLADLAEGSETYFEVERMRDDRMHYARGYREWFDRLSANEDEAVRIAGREVYDKYRRYLRLFSYSFESGAFGLLRLTFRRLDRRG